MKLDLLLDLGSSDTRAYVFEPANLPALPELVNAQPKIYDNSFYRVMTVFDGDFSEDALNSDRDFALFISRLQESPAYAPSDTIVFKYKDGVYAHGLVVEREYRGQAVKALPTGVKVDFESTYLSIQNVLTRYLFDNYGADFPEAIDLNLMVMLPPSVKENYSSLFISRLVENLTDLQLFWAKGNVSSANVKINLSEQDIVICSEGNIALSNLAFSLKLTDDPNKVKLVPKPLYTEQINGVDGCGKWLLFDFGSSTLDVYLVHGHQANMKTRKTFNTGFMRVLDIYADELTFASKSKTPLTSEMVKDSIETCQFYINNEMVDTSAVLNKAKMKFVSEIYNEIVSWISSLGISPAVLRGCMFIGGGALPSERKTVEKDSNGNKVEKSVIVSESVAYYVHKALTKQLIPNLRLFESDVPVRYANILGLKSTYIYKSGFVTN